MDDENELSPIEMMALRARHNDVEQERPFLKMVSFRVPIDLLASVDAFASITSQSRNNTLIDLVKAGVYAVANALENSDQYEAAREHFLEQHIGE